MKEKIEADSIIKVLCEMKGDLKQILNEAKDQTIIINQIKTDVASMVQLLKNKKDDKPKKDQPKKRG